MDDFDARLDRLERILRGTEQYGDDPEAGPVDQGLQFQLDEMLDEIVARTRERSAASIPEHGIDLLVSLSGFSPMGTILAYHLLRPRRLLVIGSEETKGSINVIAGAVVKEGLLQYSNFNHEPCDPTDPMSIYQLIKARLDKVALATRRRPTAVIDITGGKKVMSAAAALAAWQLDLRLCYLDGRFSPRLRQHLPGEDRLLMLPNPAALFGDQEMDRARALFDSGSFDAARDRYAQLAESVPEPAKARFMAALSGLYQAWCDLDLDLLPRRAAETRSALRRADHHTSTAFWAVLEEQLAFLERLTSGENTADLVLCFAVLGRFYLDRGRKDFAAMLFHRAIEGALAHRLVARLPGFDCARPDYSLFPDGETEVYQRYTDALARSGLPREKALPSSVGNLAAVLLLEVLDDPMLGPARLATPPDIRELGDVADIRDGSVLARGSRSISAAGLDRLVKVADGVLEAYWQQHGDGHALKPQYQRLAFIKAPF
jgi:tetratricopeptide (TPR) repeat protein